MSDLSDAVELFGQLKRQFDAFAAVGAALGNIRDLEARQTELDAPLQSKRDELKALTKQVDDLSAEVAALRLDRDVAGVEALNQARVDAADLRNQADQAAKAVTERSAAEARAADELMAGKKVELQKLQNDIDAAGVTLGSLNADIDAAHAAVRQLLGPK